LHGAFAIRATAKLDSLPSLGVLSGEGHLFWIAMTPRFMAGMNAHLPNQSDFASMDNIRCTVAEPLPLN